MTHQMLEQINQSMDLNFLNQNSEVNFMKLVDVEILDQNFFMDNIVQLKLKPEIF